MLTRVSRIVCAGAFLCALAIAAPEASHAAGPPNFHGVPVGTPEPAGLPTRSPAAQRVYDLKMQVGQLLVNHQQVPQAIYAELRQLTHNPNIGVTGPSTVPFTDTATSQNTGITPNYYYNGVYCATVDSGVSNYQEPTTLPSILAGYGSAFYNNMCGPGSATKLLSHYIPSTINSYSSSTFSGSGMTNQEAYMAYLAAGAPNPGGQSYAHYAINPNQGMMNKNDPGAGNNWNTENGDEANVIDQILGYSFDYAYGTDYPGDGSQRFNTSQFPLSNFTGELYYDLQSAGVPMVMAADTWGLQGWPGIGGLHAIHLVTINGYSPNANNNLWYFDSASNSSAYGNSVNGFHSNWAISTVVGSNNGLLDSVW